MTITMTQLSLYAGALLILFITPGPVWLAMIARCLSGGFRQALPLAMGVALGDVVWPLIVILGLSTVVGDHDGFLVVLRYVAGAILIWMGWVVIRSAGKLLEGNSQLTKPGIWAGFIAGVVAVGANPKASVFYIALMPGFFDVGSVTALDIAAICGMSFTVPLLGNLILAVFVDHIRRFLQSPKAVKRTNFTAGVLLILVGVIIPFT
ncbi:MAG: LysE family translocator, partial [Planktomarina sp.]